MVKDVIQSNHFLKGILERAGVAANQGQIARLRGAINISQTEANNIKLHIIWDDSPKAYNLINMVYDNYQAQVAERINVYTTNKLQVAEENYQRHKEVFAQANNLLADFQKRNVIIFPPQNLAISDQYYLDLKASWRSLRIG